MKVLQLPVQKHYDFIFRADCDDTKEENSELHLAEHGEEEDDGHQEDLAARGWWRTPGHRDQQGAGGGGRGGGACSPGAGVQCVPSQCQQW